MDKKKEKILYISFNQDNTCFAVGTEIGYKIYDLLNPNLDYYERVLDGGIGIIEMLYKSNILVLVGGGKYPKYPQNKVILFDDNSGKIITELSFNGYVNNVKLKKDRIIIVCDKKIYIFNLLTFQHIDIIDFDNVENKNGLIAITYEQKINFIAYPDKAIGYARVRIYDNTIQKGKLTIKAHETSLLSLSFNNSGNILATASIEGDYLRLFKTDNAVFLYQFLININKKVYSINFDIENNFICTSIGNGTICVFNLKNANDKSDEIEKLSHRYVRDKRDNDEREIIANLPKKSFWNKMFSKDESYWSILYLPEKMTISTFINGNVGKNKIVAIGAQGNFYLARFDPMNMGVPSIKEEEKSLGIDQFEF